MRHRLLLAVYVDIYIDYLYNVFSSIVMASDKEYLFYIVNLLRDVDNVSSRYWKPWRNKGNR